MPNEEYTWLHFRVDLNKDGKQDVLMHHPFTLRDAHGARTRRLPPGTEPHRVTMADRPRSPSSAPLPGWVTKPTDIDTSPGIRAVFTRWTTTEMVAAT